MRPARFSLVLVALAGTACSQAQMPRPSAPVLQPADPAGVSAPQSRDPTPMPRSKKPPAQGSPRPQLGGKLVPNTSVYVPNQARAGSTLHGRAPVGSNVEFQGKQIAVAGDGSFTLRLSAGLRGRIPVPVVRPAGQTPLTVLVEIVP